MTTLNLATILRTSARNDPDKAALIIGSSSLTYRQLDGMARKVSAALDNLGLGDGDHVAMMLPNVPQFTVTYFGALYRGSPVIPLNVLFKSNEVSFHLDDSDAQVLIVWEGFLSEAKAGFDKTGKCKHLVVVPQDPKNVQRFDDERGDSDESSLRAVHNFNLLLSSVKQPREQLAPTRPGDTAVILYTSGTTGTPKGAELSHFNLFQNAQHMCTNLLPLRSDDTFLAALPFFHIFGQTCVQNSAIFVGATIVLLPRFDPTTALRLMQETGVTFFAGVPTMYFALLHYPRADTHNVSSLRLCVCGGSSMPAEVMTAFDAKHDVNILEGYGLSETSPVASFNVMDKPKKVGSIGIPIEFVEFRLVDKSGRIVTEPNVPGEIMIKGVNVMKGYYNDPEATKKVIDDDGWFATGDIATRDEDGYYFIVDRKKDVVIRGGYNVYSREVEEVLYQHEAIAEAAVVGIPDAKNGEEVKAIVALKPGKECTDTDVIEFCKSRLAAYKYPRIVQFMETLPKGPTGKILKRELRRAASS